MIWVAAGSGFVLGVLVGVTTLVWYLYGQMLADLFGPPCLRSRWWRP